MRCSRNTYISSYVHVTARNLILKSMSEFALRPRMFTHLTIKSLFDFSFFAGDFCKKSMLFSIFNNSAYFVSGMKPGLTDFLNSVQREEVSGQENQSRRNFLYFYWTSSPKTVCLFLIGPVVQRQC